MTFDLADHADTFATAALGHVGREYPHVQTHVMAGAEAPFAPSERHPIFYGSYDWHSCVHGYWLLARLLRRFPQAAFAPAVRARLDAVFTESAVAGEVAYFARPEARGFERPYGWAWLLMLAAELRLHTSAWAGTLQPLEAVIVERFRDFLPRADYPLRAGVHSSTAFALLLADVYAQAAGDRSLAQLIETKALAWYKADADCQAWEPSGDEFLSPALMEAALMKRVMPSAAFDVWFHRFLPRLADREPSALFTPARVSDRSDGKIAHLDGLNLSRAWCWRMLARGETDALAATLEMAADRHLAASLPHVTGDYMGEHWLASFALLALDNIS